MALESLHFLRPLWLFGLLPVALLVAAALHRSARSSAWRGLVDEHLLRHLLVEGEAGARRWPLWALTTAWVSTCIALAGPAWERLPQPLFQALDPIVVALDLSRTMEKDDLSPSRRMRARYELQDLLDRESGGQIGLVLFSDEPFVAVPLTDDARVVAELLPSLTESLMPADGDRADRAIAEASSLLDQAGAPNGRILLMTDGVGAHAQAAAAAASRAASSGHSVSVLGLAAGPGLAAERDALVAIATSGNGTYADVRADDSDLDRVLARDLLEPAVLGERSAALGDEWRDLGAWLLLVPLLLAPLAFRRGWLVAAAVWLALAPAGEANASLWADLWQRRDQQATAALDAGRAEEAAELFEDPAWRAAAQYRAERYQDAAQSYERLGGVEGSYNRGNALARSGDLKGALAAYDQALQAAPTHEDARFNRDLVERLLRQQEQDRERQGSPEGASDRQSQQEQDPEQAASGQEQAGQPQGSPAAGDRNAEAAPPSGGTGDPQAGAERDASPAPGGDHPGKAEAPQDPTAGHAGDEETAAAHGEPGAPDSGANAAGTSDRDGSAPARTEGAPSAAQPADASKRRDHTAEAADGSLSEGVSQALADAEPEAAPDPATNEDEPTRRGGNGAPARKPFDEEAQTREQRLRQVPDDPGGLLRARIYRRYAERRYAQEVLTPW